MRKSIIANTLVKNEGRYLWFSVKSVVDYIDKVVLWDTGSSDITLQIIKELQRVHPEKIEFRQFNDVNINEFTVARQKMLDKTESDWIMILDGDEVWWDESIKFTVELLQKSGDNYDSLVHRYLNPIGDIYHIQDDAAHKYQIDGQKGNINIRFMNRKISGLSAQKPHGQFGYYDKKGKAIQNMVPTRRFHFKEVSYMHFTHMIRSSDWVKEKVVPKRKLKFKYELGKSLPLDFYYPEVFFRDRPDIIPSPWVIRNKDYMYRASIKTPFRSIKRKLPYIRSGY